MAGFDGTFFQHIIEDVDKRINMWKNGDDVDKGIAELRGSMVIDVRASRELQIAAFAYKEGKQDAMDNCGCADCYTG